MVVLSEDIFCTDIDRIKDIKVMKTIFDGEFVYDANIPTLNLDLT